jgi:acyl carrier protein
MPATTSNSKLSQESIQNWLVQQLTEQLSLDASTINVSEPLTRYGLDSIDAVTLVGDLEDWLDLELPDTLFWDYPTIAQAAQFLVDNYDISPNFDSADNSSEREAKSEDLEPVASSKGQKSWGGLWGKFTGS